MRSSRLSRDTSKLFDRASTASPSSPPRRSTRSSLSRFYATSTTATTTPDIEDAFSSPSPKRRKVSRSTTISPIKSELVEDALHTISSPPNRRQRKPARKTVDPLTGATTVTPPSDWEEIYNTVKRMRAPGGAAYPAAVDTMGCERLADVEASPRDQRFHTLVALMLSSQTKDTVNAVAMARMKKEMPAHKQGAPMGLNLENMLAVEPAMLNEMIWAVGFHNNKTKYLKQTAVILRDKWDSDIPDTIEGLTSLPGVGPKMGYLCLSAAWDKTEGIGVDVHVHRITNLWGWHTTKNPEETRLALQSWLPQDRWRDINHMLVGLGQAVCLPVGRRCGECDLGLEGLCKAAEKKKVVQGRKRVKDEEIVKEDGSVLKIEAVKTEVVIKEEVVNESLDIGDVLPSLGEESGAGRSRKRRPNR
ncbi:putative DNA repair protein Ntg1 [Sarocladium strictum]